MPLNVRAVEISNSSVRLRWMRPLRPNGLVLGYRLYHMRNNNFTDVVTVKKGGGAKVVEHLLEGLGKNGKNKHVFICFKSSLALVKSDKTGIEFLNYSQIDGAEEDRTEPGTALHNTRLLHEYLKF